MVRRAIAPSGWGDGLDVLVGAEQTERHNHPDPAAKQLQRLSRAAAAGSATRLQPANAGADPDGDRRTDDEPYRLVILDCPPSLGQLTRSALAAAHRAVLVTDPTMFAVSGVQRAFDAVQTERQRANPDLQPLGVFVNRVRPRNTEHEFRIAELRELFGPLVLTGVLPDRSAIQQAQGACLPIQRWDTPGAREASAVFTLLLGRVLRSDARRAGESAADPAGHRLTRRQLSGARLSATAPPSPPAPTNCSACRSRSSASRRPTSRVMPASAAARVSEQEAKNAAHSASSGATTASSCQTLRVLPRRGRGRGAHRQHGRSRPQRGQVGQRVAVQRVRLAVRLGQPVGGLPQQPEGRPRGRGRGELRRGPA